MKFLTICLALGAASSSVVSDFRENYGAEEILVKWRADVNLSSMDALHAAIGARLVQQLPQLRVQRVALSRKMKSNQALEYYARKTEVEYTEQNGAYHALYLPDDARLPEQWNLFKIQCPGGWDITHGSRGAVIAICDTGINASHPDLAGKVVSQRNILDGTNYAPDGNGHGTVVAGIAAAATDNGVGIAGVGFDCSLMAVKVLTDEGSGTFFNIAAGIVWAADNGANVINLSLGGSTGSQVVLDAVNYAWDRNCLLAAAAGGGGSTAKNYPAAYENCIAVAATDKNDARAGFSSYGADWVDVAAPGVDILSTSLNNSYTFSSGTSMSCAEVAGQAGLLFSHLGSQASNSSVRRLIEESCDYVGAWVAYGRINAYNSLLAADGAEAFLPNAAVTLKGTHLAGSVASLGAEDLDCWVQAADYDPTNPQAVISSLLLADGAVTQSSYAAGRVKAAVKSSSSQTKYRMRAAKSNGLFVTLTDNIPGSLANIVIRASLPNPVSDFIDVGNGNRVRLELRNASANRFAGFFKHYSDVVAWELTP